MNSSDMTYVEPGTRAFLDALAASGGPGLHELSVDDARRMISSAQDGPTANPPADIEARTLLGGPTGEVQIIIVRPQGGGNANLPVVMFFHGAGWVLGGWDTHERLAREIATGAKVAVVFVDYDRSPEARYPIAIEQAYAATKFIADNGRSLNLDPARIAVMGDSVGGNMAAAVTLLAKERHGPNIDVQILFYPVTDANFDTGSYNQFAAGYFLTRNAMTWFWNHYLPDQKTRREPTASPLRAPLDQLKGLPPALIITGENDVLRDEGEAYAHKLAHAGVEVTAARYLGTIHDFVMLNALAETPAARAALAQANAMLRAVFAVT